MRVCQSALSVFAAAASERIGNAKKNLASAFVTRLHSTIVRSTSPELVECKTPDATKTEAKTLDENWAAFVDDDGLGVGIYVPGVKQATCYRFADPGDAACSYVAPLRTFAVEPGLDYAYDAYLTVGKVKEIRERFQAIHDRAGGTRRPEADSTR